MAKTEGIKEKGKRQSKPISLKPLKFDEAVSDLLKVEPPQKTKGENSTEKSGKEESR